MEPRLVDDPAEPDEPATGELPRWLPADAADLDARRASARLRGEAELRAVRDAQAPVEPRDEPGDWFGDLSIDPDPALGPWARRAALDWVLTGVDGEALPR